MQGWSIQAGQGVRWNILHSRIARGEARCSRSGFTGSEEETGGRTGTYFMDIVGRTRTTVCQPFLRAAVLSNLDAVSRLVSPMTENRVRIV